MQRIDRRQFLAGTLGAAGVLVLGGCKASEDPAGPGQSGAQQDQPADRVVLRLAGGDQGFPSPFAYTRGGGYIQMSYIYDTLLWKDSTGNLLPWLASSYTTSPDKLVYTFELRENVRWHDGQPLTPEDVVFSFAYHRDQKLPATIIAQPVPDIAEVRATGPRTVEFRLSKPVATFLQFGGAGAIPIVPKHIWSSVTNAATATDPKLLVGTGPYRLESYSRGEGSYLYAANDDYFLGRPVVRRIENRPVGEGPAAGLTALTAGEVDVAGVSGVRPEVLAAARGDSSLAILEEGPGASQLALNFNLAKGGALADVRFRQACCRAIDRADLVKRLFGGQGRPGNPGWIPPDNPFHAKVEQYDFDVAAANKMLDDAGYLPSGGGGTRQTPAGEPLRFTLLSANPVPPVAEVLVNSLKAIGVEVVPQGVDTPTFNERMSKLDVELSLIASGGMSSDLAPDYLRLVYNSKTKLAQHAQGYVNPEVDDLTQRQLATTDLNERKKIVTQAQELIARDVPILPLFYPTSYTVFRKSTFDQWYVTPGGVAGVVPTANNKQAFVTGIKAGTKVRATKG